MSFTLRTVSVYSFGGECRTVDFSGSGLRILTGRAKTGKSSIIDIIDYCFGRSECYVAEGVIRRNVSWFAVEIESGNDRLFIARRNPDADAKTSSDIYIRRGHYDQLPLYPDLQKNTNIDGLIRLLTRFAGIAENEHRPLTGTRGPLQATLRHALHLCFQKQDEIASRDRLFHRQGDEFIPQSIKDTFPYFLGAVDEDHFLRQNELDDAKLQLRQLETNKAALQKASTDALQRFRRFLIDAKRVGLVDQSFETTDNNAALAELGRAISQDLQSPSFLPSGSDLIQRLENELKTLREQLIETRNEIRATTHFLREQTSFSREAAEQRARLSSIGLYSGKSDGENTCPLCDSALEAPLPGALALNTALEQLDRQLDSVGAESPHLQQRLDALGKKGTELQYTIVSTQRNLERAYADDERARRIRDQVIERARVVGRIGAFIDQTNGSNEENDIDAQIEAAKRRVEMLAERVNTDMIQEKVYTFLNLIADKMTEYAGELDLEHAGGRIRLDITKLTVVAETVTGPISLNRIGSGENWIGYHVVTLLALHHWFRAQGRPVPGIVIFDQPTQAHYPPEADQAGRVDGLQDADRRAVYRLFELMHQASEEIGHGFQLIVLDHAHLEEPWFNDAIIERWRGEEALIPAEWIEVD
ncbi:DUF3732 domain-containing protein [Hyphomonas atlantica corrig.]|uniref:DUF3732 domain-containing protein n=1 Tax=Hyphomonas atlantica TaxID=1280948 RepID=UPI0023523883|nr:DUF3732 domain-containing protein [Hyphomonas atlantica]